MPKFEPRAPRSKTEFMSRILSYDFSGDLRDLFPGGVNLTRMASNSLMLTAKDNPETRFLLSVHIPRTEEQLAVHREKLEARRAETKKRPGRSSQKPMATQDGPTSH